MKKLLLLLLLSTPVTAGELMTKEETDKYITGMEEEQKQTILNTCFWQGDIARSLQIGKQENPHMDKSLHESAIKYILEKDGFDKTFVNAVLGIFQTVWQISVHKSPTKVFEIVYEECRMLMATYHREGFSLHEQFLGKKEAPWY